MKFTVVPSDEQRWPSPVTIALTREGRETSRWTIRDPAASLAVVIADVEAGAHELRVEAEHHRAAVRTLIAGDKPAQVGSVVLKRFPVVYGRVVSRRGHEGLTGARIHLPSDALLATVTDPRGEFEAEITTDGWPEFLRIVHPPYGMRIVALPKLATDTDLPPIELSVAAAVRFAVEIDTIPDRLSAELLTDEQLVVARQVAAHGEKDLVFRDLAPGKYRLLLSGDGPLEKHVTEIDLDEGETREETISVSPARLTVAVTHKGQPVRGATLDITNVTSNWESSASTDDAGTVTGKLWQQGDFMAAITVEGHAATFAERTFKGGKELSWRIALSEQSIGGVVVDGESGAPVANATVYIRTERPDSSTTIRRITDAQGRFDLAFAQSGEHQVTATADGYVQATTTFTTTDDERERSVRIALQRGVERVVRVRNTAGHPIGGALIVDERGMMGTPVFTDAAGLARISVPASQPKTLYVLPKEGSFAVTAAGSPANGEIDVVVPVGEASIIVRTQDQTFRPLSNVYLLMRYGGHFFPAPVTMAMTAFQGRSFVTAAFGKLVLEHLPPGVYDFWPYFTQAEADALMQTIGPDAPARIAAQPGPNAITLTFARKDKPGAP